MSIVLAKILGIFFLGIGIAFFLNPSRFRRMYKQVMSDDNFLLYGGLLALIIGAFIVSVHNIWIAAWPVLITILGWWSILKGFTILIYPDLIQLFAFLQNRSNVFYRLISIIWLVIGIFLISKGWQ